MTTELFSDVVAAEIEPMPGAQPIAVTAHVIVSWYAPERRWKLWPGLYADRQRAATAAQRFPAGHTHYCVLEIRLPGV